MKLSNHDFASFQASLMDKECPFCHEKLLVANAYIYQETSDEGNGKIAYRNVAKATCHGCGLELTFLKKPE